MGGLRGPPYRAVELILDGLARRWHDFDGWAISRGLNLAELPFVRLLNLGLHYLTSTGTPELRQALFEAYQPPPPPPVDGDDADDEWTPEWWPGDEEASMGNMVAAVALGMTPDV